MSSGVPRLQVHCHLTAALIRDVLYISSTLIIVYLQLPPPTQERHRAELSAGSRHHVMDADDDTMIQKITATTATGTEIIKTGTAGAGTRVIARAGQGLSC